MFRVCWDKEINGVLLNSSWDESLNLSPRPVYREELDILGFDKYWKYPEDIEEPLLWALGRRYYYKGILVAEAKGGSLFEAPEIVITEDGKGITLKPIDMNEVIERNKEALFIIENEAMDFVYDTYKKYKNKVDFIAVAFSGGKDSQVVLDIVSRVLPPDEYIVVFSDTTMELPYTYETVERTKKEYQERYPNLKFYTIKPPKPAIEFWEDFGPPSRIHRWCCTVMKTAPFVNFFRELNHERGNSKNPKILVFDGVRAEESHARSGYSRVGLNTKYILQINAEPIQNWKLVDIFLYLYFRKININPFYKIGAERIGCSVCPFTSPKSEFLIYRFFPDKVKSYIEIIKKMVNVKLRKNDSEIIDTYIGEGQWKKRAGGRDLVLEELIRYDYFNNEKTIVKIKKLDKDKFDEFLNIVSYYKTNNNLYEIKNKNDFGNLKIEFNQNEVSIEINSSSYELTGIIKKIINKAVYCVGCKNCEILCKNGAIRFEPKITISTEKCVHCLECLNIEKGCQVAKSLNITESAEEKSDRGVIMKKITHNKYQTFGLREEWLNNFIYDTENFISDIQLAYNTIKKKTEKGFNGKTKLGVYQIVSMSVWLMEAEFLNDKKELSENFTFFKNIWLKNKRTMWDIILTNLYFNSSIMKWYLDNFQWKTEISKDEIKKRLIDDDPLSSARTISNDLNALFQTMTQTPIGNEIGLCKIIDDKRKIIKKEGTSDVSLIGICYNLYKTSMVLKTNKFRIFQFYDPNFFGGPYKVYGIGRTELIDKLISIQSKSSDILHTEITADLDNITLNFSGLEEIEKLIS
ncbi:MAG: phosphoadenosine phosphosulfate reductase family protein [Syntrophales bacterium]|nr:phosphoadenosine phosphosulfate reductase family protein [Syntrophales bacterium]